MSSPKQRIPRDVWKPTAVATIGSFMAQVDATVVNVSLSSLASELHATLNAIQWVTSGYLLALALALPLSGWLVDRIGTKALYLWCFGIFTLTSTLCGLAWSAESLIAFRILQGMSGGLLAPLAQMVIVRAAGKHLAQVVSVSALPVILAPMLGPVVAGAILQFASWRWLFLINLPVGAVALALAAMFLPSDREERRPRGLDLIGLALLSPGLVLFLYGSDHLAETGGIVALAVSVLMFVLFYRRARAMGDAALIDLRLFRGKNFPTAVAGMFMINGLSFAGQMLIPIWLVRGCGLSPSQAGWMLAPMGLGMMCTYSMMGRLTVWFKLRTVATCGSLLALAGTLLLVLLAGHGLSVPLLAIALFLRGAGLSTIGIPSITTGYASVPREDMPMATTAMNIVQRIGGPTLTTLCAIFLGWRMAAAPGPAGMSSAFVAAFVLLAALQALLVLVALRLPSVVAHAEPEVELSIGD